MTRSRLMVICAGLALMLAAGCAPKEVPSTAKTDDAPKTEEPETMPAEKPQGGLTLGGG